MTHPRIGWLLQGMFGLCLLANAVGQAPEPDPTLPPVGQQVQLQLFGRGVQIYICKQAEGGAPAWSFVAPEATLQDATGTVVGAHASGPMWTLKDGSSVHGKVTAQRPSPDAGSIPWLLLEAHDGEGTLERASYIRRSETKGGKAQPEGCNTAHLGAESRVPYTATYTFYSRQSK